MYLFRYYKVNYKTTLCSKSTSCDCCALLWSCCVLTSTSWSKSYSTSNTQHRWRYIDILSSCIFLPWRVPRLKQFYGGSAAKSKIYDSSAQSGAKGRRCSTQEVENVNNVDLELMKVSCLTGWAAGLRLPASASDRRPPSLAGWGVHWCTCRPTLHLGEWVLAWAWSPLWSSKCFNYFIFGHGAGLEEVHVT